MTETNQTLKFNAGHMARYFNRLMSQLMIFQLLLERGVVSLDYQYNNSLTAICLIRKLSEKIFSGDVSMLKYLECKDLRKCRYCIHKKYYIEFINICLTDYFNLILIPFILA